MAFDFFNKRKLKDGDKVKIKDDPVYQNIEGTIIGYDKKKKEYVIKVLDLGWEMNFTEKELEKK